MRDLLHRQYNDKSALKNYLGFYAKWKWRLFASFWVYMVKASPGYILPILTAGIINMLVADHNDSSFVIRKLIEIFIIATLLIAQNIPTHMLFIWLLSVPSRSVEKGLRSALCSRLQHLSIPYHNQNKAGELQNKVIRDVEAIENMTRMLLDQIPGITCNIGVAVIVTAIKAPLFLLFYIAIVPITVLIFWSIRKKLASKNRAFRQSVEEMSGKISEMLRLIPITRAHNVEQVEMERVNKKFDKIMKTGLEVDYITSLFGSINWVVFMIFNLLTLVIIAILYQKKILNIGVGDIGLLTGYFGTLTMSVLGIMSCLPAISKGLESVKSIGEILECPDIELNENKPFLDKIVGDFKFHDVSFYYPGSEKHALEKVSLTVKAGETIAFVGPSGAGKSTMANLLIGFVRPSDGKIILDDKDMNEVDLRSYRQFISVVTQETLLFDGTIKENICYGSNSSEAEIVEAIKNADLEKFIATLPDGINTQVRENGSRLSGGQKQRLAIARALLRDPKVLILDEATSALDIESENQIQAALDRLIKGRTTFIIAHRLSTVRNADRIVVMEAGKIIEIGSHDELIANDGLYKSMYKKFNPLS